MAPSWTHLIRFIAKEDGQIHLGQIDATTYPDVGLASFEGKEITAKLIRGSVYDGTVTDEEMTVVKLLSPLSTSQTPLIRCIGLNYIDHAHEANLPIPDTPVLFIKPRTSLNGPWPAKIPITKPAQDGSSDYEAELTLIISKDCKDVTEEEAMSYVLGYTAGNDVSARTVQFESSQWCFSKGFDGSAPIGPVLVRPEVLEKEGKKLDLKISALHNGNVVQDSRTDQMIFTLPHLIAHLSRGTTLEQGTIIMTGTPPGIGAMRSPKVVLNNGDDMRVYIEGIGTLINEVYWVK